MSAHIYTRDLIHCFQKRTGNARRWELIGSQTACDASAGEQYQVSSSKFLETVDLCKSLCADTMHCQSITFFKSGWCGLFSTPCLRTKTSGKAVSYRSSGQRASQEEAGQSDTYKEGSSANLKGFVAEDSSTAGSPISTVAIAVGCSVAVVVVVAAVVASVLCRRARQNQSDDDDVENAQEVVSGQDAKDEQEY